MPALVALVTGTRPEVVKIAPLCLAPRESAKLRPVFVTTGQHRQMLEQTPAVLGITPSHFRPRVINDNPHAESLFRTLKYHPSLPAAGFAFLGEARAWTHRFVQWYHHEHLHSSLRFVTPAQKHAGEDTAILARRAEVYRAARERHPERWNGRRTRNWSPVRSTTLNPVSQRSLEPIAKRAA